MSLRKIFLLLLFAVLFSTADAQFYRWAGSAGSAGNDHGMGIVVDTAGNTFVTGDFTNTIDLDYTGGTANLTSNGFADIFVAKYDAIGNYLWAFNIGDFQSDGANNIWVDSTGNIYITGYFSATVDFDPGSGTASLTSAGSQDIFFAKYDNNGNYLWAKSIGSTTADLGYGITTDAQHNVYITGTFSGQADFDPGSGVVNIFAGSSDAYLAKYDANGNYSWAYAFSSTSVDYGYDVAVDPAGNIYLCGCFSNQAQFDPLGNNAQLFSNGGTDLFFAKYSPTMNLICAKGLGSATFNEYCRHIAYDHFGNILITTDFSAAFDADPGVGVVTLNPVGNSDIFFGKYSGAGVYKWANSMGNNGNDAGRDIAADSSGKIFLTGWFAGTVDFDPGSGTANLTSNGSDDAFFAQYDSSGNYIWAKGMGGNANDEPVCIAIDAAGNQYLTGTLASSADYDPDPSNSVILPAYGLFDIFFGKYGPGPAGVAEAASNFKFICYPNPSAGIFTVMNYEEGSEIKITDLLGSVIFTSTLSASSTQIDLSEQTKGMYFFTVFKDGKYSGSGKLLLH